MCKGSSTTTTQSTPDPNAYAAYNSLLQRAAGVGNLPYTAYNGELVAPINAQQQMGIGNINANAGFAAPYIAQATQYANAAAAPITGAQIQQYQNPYTQQVINATEAQFNQQNQMQQSQLAGNAAAQGALGGDRVGVAQGTLAGQQQMAEAPVIAGLESQGYNTALQTALAEQQNQANAAFSLGNLGISGQNAALQGAGAQFGAGSAEQQTQQALDQALYQQFQLAQAFPYQQTQWLAGIDTGVGSQMGGTSSTTGPAPSMLGSMLGLGLLGMGVFSDERLKEGIEKVGHTDDGQPIYRFRYKDDPSGTMHMGLLAQEVEKKHPEAVHHVAGLGVVDYKRATDDAIHERRHGGLIPGLDNGGGIEFGGVSGSPWGNAEGFIPGMQITPGKGPPAPPQIHQDTTNADLMKLEGGLLGKATKSGGLGGIDLSSIGSGPVGDFLSDITGINPLGGFNRGGATHRPMMAGFGTGGIVRHYDDGGSLPLDDDAGIGRGLITAMSPGEEDRRLSMLSGLRNPDDAMNSGLGVADIVNTQSPGFSVQSPASVGATSTPVPARSAPAGLAVEAPDERVKAAQQILNKWLPGNRPVRQDGVMDDATTAEIMNYEEAHGAKPTGMIDGLFAAATQNAIRGNPLRVNGQAQNLTGEFIQPGGNNPHPYGEPAEASTRPRIPVYGLGDPAASASPSPAAEDHPTTSGGLFGFNPLGLSDNGRTALMAAGLGMMASRSPFPGVAIGEGGLRGLASYSESQKMEETKRKDTASIEHGRAQLALMAKRVQQQVDHETRMAQLAQEKAEQGKFSLIPGMGTDSTTGQQVAGSYRLNTKTGQSEFQPGVVQTQKQGAGAGASSFDQPTLTKMADQYLAGDKSVLVNLGRGAQGATDLKALRQRIAERMEERGITPEQQAVKMAEYQGMGAGQRALGTRTANIEMAANEARNMIPLALQAADAVPRTNWVPINKLIEGVQSGVISDPAQARFAAANFSLVNTYVRAIAPTGVPPESAREHALQMLSGAMSHESYKAVVQMMDQEMSAALHSPGQVMEKFRQMYGTQGGGNAAAAPAAASGSPQEGERRQFKQGWGVFHNGQWVPAGP